MHNYAELAESWGNWKMEHIKLNLSVNMEERNRRESFSLLKGHSLHMTLFKLFLLLLKSSYLYSYVVVIAVMYMIGICLKLLAF